MNLSSLNRWLKERTPGLMEAAGEYAVLVPLVEGEQGTALLYEVRAGSMRRQPGEVCFPGGRIEPGETPEQCALRETEEELAIPSRAITVLGRLDFVVHRANFILYPILAQVERGALKNMRLNPSEVAETFQVPLSHLMTTPPLEYNYKLIPQTAEDFPYDLVGIPRDYRWQAGGETVPVYPWQGRAIWGITGRITRHLVELIQRQGGMG